LIHFFFVHNLVEDDHERVRTHLLHLERREPEVGIRVMLKPTNEFRVVNRVANRDRSVFAENVEVVASKADRNGLVEERSQLQDLVYPMFLESFLVFLLLPQFGVVRDREGSGFCVDRSAFF
jgi:hypothetical protein